MLNKKYPIYGLITIVVVLLGGFSFLTGDISKVSNIDVQRDIKVPTEQRFLGVYPMPPPLPEQKILSNSIDIQRIQKQAGFTLLEPTLPKGFVLISSTYNPIYDEATIYYGPQSIIHKINDDLTIDDLLDLGVIVIDYERRINMENIDNQITRFSQNEKGSSFDVNNKKGYSMNDDFVNRQKVVIFDETEGMEITVVYNEGTMSQVKDIVRSLFS